jgi:hypothetical protein
MVIGGQYGTMALSFMATPVEGAALAPPDMVVDKAVRAVAAEVVRMMNCPEVDERTGLVKKRV